MSDESLPPGLTPSLQRIALSEPVEVDGLPKRFGKYTLLRKLATGGMAELFLALQKSVAGFEKLLVIKRVLPQMNQDSAFIDMLLSEARIAATLSHQNIVQIFDVGEADGIFYIAMEHVHGEDIRSIVRQMKAKDFPEFPVEHALAIVQGVCAGLSYAHERRDLDGTPLGIVHRDISPQNVVVTFSGDIKIIDFGIAKSDNKVQTSTKSGRLKGKVPYMSPEQARGEKIDARSDIFSAGVMLFELTTGRRLFKGQSEFETLKLICDREYPTPSSVRPGYPAALEAIVMKALAKNKSERYQTARDMQSALEDFIRAERVAVSEVALQQFMTTLFEDKLALQKEEIFADKQLAEDIERKSQMPPAHNPDQPRPVSTLSIPSASRTLTGSSTKRYTGTRPFALTAALTVALAGIGIFAAWMKTQPQTAVVQPSVVLGSITVESEPHGAHIWVNGEPRAELTPATLGGLMMDKPIEVRVQKDGFEPEKELVSLSAERPAFLWRTALRSTVERTDAVRPSDLKSEHVDHHRPPRVGPVSNGSTDPLEELPPVVSAAAVRTGTGKLNVDRAGGWCDVTIDGNTKGATPIAGIELTSGSHKVTCKTADGKLLAATVNVPIDGTARYKFVQ